MTDLFGVAGHDFLNVVELGHAYRVRVESLRDPGARSLLVMVPGSTGVAAPLIDPAWTVAATPHAASSGAGMTGSLPGPPHRNTFRTWRSHLVSQTPTRDDITTN